MKGPTRFALVVALVLGALAAAAAAWLLTTFGSRAPTGPRPQVVSAGAPTVAPAPSAVPTPGGGSERTADAMSNPPPGLVLAGVDPDGRTAHFLVEGQIRAVSIGAALPGTVMVLRRVSPQAAWLSGPADGPEVMVSLSSPQDLAVRRDAARATDQLPPGLSGQALPPSEGTVLRGEDRALPPPEMQVTVRRRGASAPGS